MNPSPPGPENGEGVTRDNADAPEKLTSNDSETVQHPSKQINGIPAPPAGSGFDDAGELVPVTLPPQDAEPLSREEILLKIIGHACGWANGHPAKWEAFRFVAGYNTLTTAEIAEGLGVSQRSLQGHVAECRLWLAELRMELRGGTVPLKGEGDQP